MMLKKPDKPAKWVKSYCLITPLPLICELFEKLLLKYSWLISRTFCLYSEINMPQSIRYTESSSTSNLMKKSIVLQTFDRV